MEKENISATFYRRCEASDLMGASDPEPSHLPSLNSLRVAKSLYLKQKPLHDDPIIIALSIMKNQSATNIIRDIGYDRFFVHYWSPL
jgi:hypothetical protein